MPFFSSKRSSTQDSTVSSIPLNDTPEDATDAKGVRRSRSLLGKLRSPSRNSRRSKSPSVRSQKARSKSPAPRQKVRVGVRSKSPVALRPPTKEISVPRQRMGRIFCRCCDMRIATALLNTIHMAMAIISELIEASKWGNRNYFKELPVLMLLVLGISGMGLVGALRFSKKPLIASSIGMGFLAYLYVVELHIIGLAMLVVIFFAQCILIDEISRGIMSEETYATEEYIDENGRKVLETVHGLSVGLAETASEVKSEIQKAKKQTQSS